MSTSQFILATFTKKGIPQVDLIPLPTIRIWELESNTLIVNSDSMIELGDGHYKYSFTIFDDKKHYAIRCDGGVVFKNSERYTFGGMDGTTNEIYKAHFNEKDLIKTADNKYTEQLYDNDGTTIIRKQEIKKEGSTLETRRNV